MPGLPSLSCRTWRRLVCASLGWLSLGLAQAEGDSLVMHRLGAPENAAAALRGPALYLKGDGPPDGSSFGAFLRQVSTDRLDVVVLGASYPDWEGECRTITGLEQVNSCTTIVIREPRDAANPAVLDAIRRAEVVYFRGGDQCNFMRWRDSPLPAAVRPVTTAVPMNTFTSSGWRPACTSASRRLCTVRRAVALSGGETNTHSAWRAAKRWPRPELPAWNSTGVRCGEGSARW